MKKLFLFLFLYLFLVAAVQLDQYQLQKLIEISQNFKTELSNSKLETQNLKKKLIDSQVKIDSMQTIINKQLQELEQTSIQLSNQQIILTNTSTNYIETIMSLKESYGSLQTKIIQLESRTATQTKIIIGLSIVLVLFIGLYILKVYLTKKLW